ncbi:MAG: UbiD family decarboxylase [Firmicutes bacterium]|nr:UbiD family decarboxylase [Bacillota bacterium]
MPKDLRWYLEAIKDQMIIVDNEVDPYTNLAAYAAQSPAPILFSNIKGYPGWKMCDMLLKTREVQGKAIGVDPKKVVPEMARIMKRPGQCVMVNTGPVKDVKMIGDAVDLYKLPAPVHSNVNSGPYITAGMCVTKDPNTGIRNVTILRNQLKSRNSTGFLMAGGHTWENLSKYEERNEPMPMAIVIGHHPLFEVAAAFRGSYEMDEFELASSLLGEPVELVKCETIDMEVPAWAEIVIEGTVPPKVRELEGPFCEFTNYCVAQGNNPVFNVSAITMRKDAIYRNIQTPRYTDHQAIASLPREAHIFSRLKDVEGGLDLHDVHTPSWGGSFLVLVQMTPHFEGQAKTAILAALSTANFMPKNVIVVDDDVNIYDARDVVWAMCTRVNPQTDVMIFDNMRIYPMDLACPQISPPGEKTYQRVGGKMGIDATKPSLFRKKEREEFERALPMGFGLKLSDLLGEAIQFDGI